MAIFKYAYCLNLCDNGCRIVCRGDGEKTNGGGGGGDGLRINTIREEIPNYNTQL